MENENMKFGMGIIKRIILFDILSYVAPRSLVVKN